MISEAEYRNQPRLNNSGMTALAHSPAHYQAWLKRDNAPTDAMLLGSATHMLVLEPERCATDIVVFEHSGRSKAGKEERAEILSNPEIVGVTADALNLAQSMREAVMRHPTARAMVETSETERPIIWDDINSGAPCKAKLDGVMDDFGASIPWDLKTTKDASPQQFYWDMRKYYARQFAFYSDGLATQAEEVKPFRVVAVEKEPPYGVRVYDLSAELYNQGVNEYQPLAILYQQCVAQYGHDSEWPNYTTEIQEI